MKKNTLVNVTIAHVYAKYIQMQETFTEESQEICIWDPCEVLSCKL